MEEQRILHRRNKQNNLAVS